MKIRLVLACGILMLMSGCVTVITPEDPPQAMKIMFWGDSITDGQWYPSYVEAFYRTRYPQNNLVFVERGWGGDAADNPLRVKRDGIPEKADVIYLMFGMNDAGYSTWDIGASTKKFYQNLKNTCALFREANPRCRFVFMSSPTLEVYEKHEMQYYPWVLRCHAQEMEKVARELNSPYIDQNLLYSGFAGAMANMFSTETLWKKGVPSELKPLMLTRDGIHPNRAGHCALAMNMLPKVPDLARLAYDGTTRKLTAEGAELQDVHVSDDGLKLSFRRRLAVLPFALPEDVVYMERLLLLSEKVNRDLFQVRNLKAGAWRLSIDGKQFMDFDAADLERGINFSDLSLAPDMVQARGIVGLVEQKNKAERKLWQRRLCENNKLWPDPKKPVKPMMDPDYVSGQQRIAVMTESLSKQAMPQFHTFALEYVPNVKTRAWTSRYQDSISCYADTVSLELAKGLQKSEIQVRLYNKTVKDQVVEFYLELDGHSDYLKTMTLKAGTNQTVKVPFMADPQKLRYTLRVFHQPVDRSFPRMHTDARICLASVMEIPQRSLSQLNADNWKSARQVTLGKEQLPKLVLRRWNGNQDLSGRFYVAWNKDALELKVDAVDDIHFPAETLSQNCWNLDSLQFAGWYKKPEGKGFRWVHFNETVFANSKGKVFWRRNGIKVSPEVDGSLKAKVIRQGNHTIYTMHVPWKALGMTAPKAGDQFHFNVGINDRDSNEGEWKYLPWSYGIWYANAPHEYGVLKLGR